MTVGPLQHSSTETWKHKHFFSHFNLSSFKFVACEHKPHTYFQLVMSKKPQLKHLSVMAARTWTMRSSPYSEKFPLQQQNLTSAFEEQWAASMQHPGSSFLGFSTLFKETSTCRPQGLGIEPPTIWSLGPVLDHLSYSQEKGNQPIRVHSLTHKNPACDRHRLMETLNRCRTHKANLAPTKVRWLMVKLMYQWFNPATPHFYFKHTLHSTAIRFNGMSLFVKCY